MFWSCFAASNASIRFVPFKDMANVVMADFSECVLTGRIYRNLRKLTNS